jgi:DNA-binding NtrC family response regulator
VRAGPPPLRAPIIVVAGASVCDDGAVASAIDVIDVIDAPTDVARLGQALRRALTRSERERPLVLHVDDDEDLLKVVALALEPEARILTATDLVAARTILAESKPDAAILDLRLAEGSGLDLLPLLVDPDGVAIPTVLYSAQDVSAELAARVDAVLVKARGSLPDLKATLRRIVRAPGRGRTTEA